MFVRPFARMASMVAMSLGVMFNLPPRLNGYDKVGIGGRGRRKRGGPRTVHPQNQSFRSLRRAVNTGGFVPPEPSIAEMKRHAWFRKKLAGAALRVRLDQEQPGDRELLAAAKR